MLIRKHCEASQNQKLMHEHDGGGPYRQQAYEFMPHVALQLCEPELMEQLVEFDPPALQLALPVPHGSSNGNQSQSVHSFARIRPLGEPVEIVSFSTPSWWFRPRTLYVVVAKPSGAGAAGAL